MKTLSLLLVLLAQALQAGEIRPMALEDIVAVWDVDLELLDLEAIARLNEQTVDEVRDMFEGLAIGFTADTMTIIHFGEELEASPIAVRVIHREAIRIEIEDRAEHWTLVRSPTGLLCSIPELPVPIPLRRAAAPADAPAVDPLRAVGGP